MYRSPWLELGNHLHPTGWKSASEKVDGWDDDLLLLEQESASDQLDTPT